jgi:hypothetical protein
MEQNLLCSLAQSQMQYNPELFNLFVTTFFCVSAMSYIACSFSLSFAFKLFPTILTIKVKGHAVPHHLGELDIYYKISSSVGLFVFLSLNKNTK